MENFMLWSDILILSAKILLIALPALSALLFLVKTALYFLERKTAAPEKRQKMKKSLGIFGVLALAALLLAFGGWLLLKPLF